MQKGVSFVVINDKHHQQGNPFASATRVEQRVAAAAAKNKSLGPRARVAEEFVLPDGPRLGPAIASASKALVGGPEPIHAFAVREYGDAKACKILRFMTFNTGLEEEFRNTFTLCLAARLTNSLQRRCLFYPSKTAAEVAGAEDDPVDDDCDSDDEPSTQDADVGDVQDLVSIGDAPDEDDGDDIETSRPDPAAQDARVAECDDDDDDSNQEARATDAELECGIQPNEAAPPFNNGDTIHGVEFPWNLHADDGDSDDDENDETIRGCRRSGWNVGWLKR